MKEAKGVDEVWGASQLLEGDEAEDANPFLGLGLMRRGSNRSMGGASDADFRAS